MNVTIIIVSSTFSLIAVCGTPISNDQDPTQGAAPEVAKRNAILQRFKGKWKEDANRRENLTAFLEAASIAKRQVIPILTAFAACAGQEHLYIS